MIQRPGGTEAPLPPAAARPLVIVLGMHRSGTSLCANMLHALGVDMAEAPGVSPANQRGHWERPRINDLHDAVLALFGRGWNDPAHHLPLPDGWWEDARVASVQDQLVAFLQPRFGAAPHFGFKDPRTARLLALWPPVLQRIGAAPAYVFCVRNPAQVARSVSARDSFPADQAAYRWLIYNAHAVCGVGESPVCVMAYEDWFAAPQAALARLAAFVGAPPPAPTLLALIDAGLRHDAPAPPDTIAPIAADLHRQIAESTTRFPPDLLACAATILGCEQAVMPFLRDAAILRASLAAQTRAITDLQALVAQLRAARQASNDTVVAT